MFPKSNAENGEVSSSAYFHYRQDTNILTAEYSGGEITESRLIGIVQKDGSIEDVDVNYTIF